MAEEATSLGEHTHGGVRYVNTHGEKAPESGVKGSGGAIFTGFHPNWYNLLDREKQSIFDNRERLKIKGGGKLKSSDKKKQIRASYIKSKKKSSQKIQGNISFLKAKCKKLEEKRSASKEADEPQENAGDQFGCSKGKKQKKRTD